MERSEQKSRDAADSRSLTEAVRRARIRLAEDIDDVSDRRISELARLEMLKGELEGIFDDIPKSDQSFELVLVPSLPARLWIDMFAYVMRDANTGNYCFIRNKQDGPKVLAQSLSATEIADRVLDYVADELVRRERQLQGYAELERLFAAPAPAPAPPQRRLSVSLALWAFVIGMLTGVIGFLAYSFYMPL